MILLQKKHQLGINKLLIYLSKEHMKVLRCFYVVYVHGNKGVDMRNLFKMRLAIANKSSFRPPPGELASGSYG